MLECATKMRRWQSGQLQQAVNLSDLSYTSSNLVRRTKTQNLSVRLGFVVFSSAGQDSKEASGEAGMNTYSFRIEAAGSRRTVVSSS